MSAAPLNDQRDRGPDAYVPIRDYAVIGDCHGAALVSLHGSVDWCCLERFDADPIFCRLLDATKGGFVSVRPEGDYQVTRAYLGNTNVLRTVFSAQGAKVALTDFMPVGRAPEAGVHDYVTLNAPFWLVRIVEALEGTPRVRIRYRPTVDWARRRARLAASQNGIVAENGPWLHTDLDLSIHDDLAEGTVELRAGEHRYLVVALRPLRDGVLADRVRRLLEITQAFWEEWSAYCRYRGPYREPVLRSALTLKLLTYAPTGALVAAPTASLPEEIVGQRNWDYRYCWMRDATFMLYALSALGYSGEARKFSAFLQRSCMTTHPRVQIMYGIGGEIDLRENCLDHLEGYRGSRPVRTGNAAFTQQQIDIYGEILDWALLYRSLGGRFDRSAWQFLYSLAEFVVTHWQEPDQGIWEMRGPPRHHVYSKIMCWVAIDRAVRLFGPRGGFAAVREEVWRAVLEQGVDRQQGHLVQAFGRPETDAALLLTPVLGFPAGKGTIEATIDRVQQTLGHDDTLRRYVAEDGLGGSEGAFLICSFWLVDALLQVGRVEEARTLYERLLTRANDVGLYSEEIDPETHELLGNFPQAFTHLALIQNAANLALCEERGVGALQGTHADRARHGVEAAAGPRALWVAFKKSGRLGRLRSSPASILPRE